jgi:chromosome segregation ATPase
MRAKLEAHMKDDTRLALLEQSISHINETMMRIEKRFDSIDKKFDDANKRFDRLENRIEDVRKNSWSQFCWVMGFMLAVATAFAGVLIKGHFG